MSTPPAAGEPDTDTTDSSACPHSEAAYPAANAKPPPTETERETRAEWLSGVYRYAATSF